MKSGVRRGDGGAERCAGGPRVGEGGEAKGACGRRVVQLADVRVESCGHWQLADFTDLAFASRGGRTPHRRRFAPTYRKDRKGGLCRLHLRR